MKTVLILEDNAERIADFDAAVKYMGRGDCDTNAAIVGGIVALSVGREGIPPDWLLAREPIQV